MRRIAEAFYASVGASTDPVYDLQQSDPAVEKFLGTVAARHDRTGRSENFLAKDVAQDLVLAAWRRHLQSRLAEATPAPGVPDSPELMRRRMEARGTIRQLRDWTRGEAVVRALAGLEDEEPHAESAENAELGSPAGGAGERREPEGVSPSASGGASSPSEPPFVAPPPEAPPPEEDYEDLPPDDL